MDEIAERVARTIYAESYRPYEELTARNLDATFSATIHDGDCTNQAHTCLTCEGDLGRRLAHAAIKAIADEMTRHARKDSTGSEAAAAFHIVVNWLAALSGDYPVRPENPR